MDQLRGAVRRGHDVQLHLHASYFNSRYEQGRWQQDWSEYNFAALEAERLNQIVRLGKDYLETLLRPVWPAYECFVFRAANWAVSPSQNVVRALVAMASALTLCVQVRRDRDASISITRTA